MRQEINVKQRNIERVRQAMAEEKTSTIRKLASITGLSTATCNNILKLFLETGEVKRGGRVKKESGRPSQEYIYDPDHILILSIAVDCENMKVIHYRISNRYEETIVEEDVELEYIDVDLVDRYISDLKTQYPRIRAVGIGVPPMSEKQARTNGLSRLNEERERASLACADGIRISVAGSANLIALGYSIGQQEADAMTILSVLSPKNRPVSSGLVINGIMQRGDARAAGEMGYADIKCFDNYDRQMDGWEPEKRICAMVCGAILLLAPSRVLLAGRELNEKLCERIEEQCRDMLSVRFLPAFTYLSDCNREYLYGVTAMARESLDPGAIYDA